MKGNDADFVLGTDEGWDAFGVVRWHSVEAISELYRYQIVLQRPAADGPIDLDLLLGSSASFRVATKARWRVVHGILAETEEIDRTSKIILYRVLLVPHFWRARHRRRCRNFVGRTLKEILRAVLENHSPDSPNGKGGLFSIGPTPNPPSIDPSFKKFDAAIGEYRFALMEDSRLSDASVSPYVVQYNETDFNFFSRILEEEGLSYYFEQTETSSVLTITDCPGQAPLFVDDERFTLRRASRSSTSDGREIVRSFSDARRLRERSVTMRDYDYLRSQSPLEATVGEPGGDPGTEGHFEFPAGEESVRRQPARHAAEIRLQRHNVERFLRDGSAGVRTMEPGHRFTLIDGDGILPDEDFLAVRVETFATELAPQGTILDEEAFGFGGAQGPPQPGYDSRFSALPIDVPFRPTLLTQKARIHGVQTAVVTAEEHDDDRPKVNADRLGRVRVRFPWDQGHDKHDRTPTSDWIRVSQIWAGAGYGGHYLPRVGHEVLVAYLQGDPARPVIIGRVYNAQNPPPYDGSQEPTLSTLKSRSSTGIEEVEGFNEVRFDDRASKEEIFLHAQRDLNEVVRANHSTSVGGNQSNKVHGDRRNEVVGEETVEIGGNRTTIFKSNDSHTVRGFREKHVAHNETIDVDGFRKTTVGLNDDLTVKGFANTQIQQSEIRTVVGFRGTKIGANDDLEVAGFRNTIVGEVDFLKAKSRKVEVSGGEDLTITGDHKIEIGGDVTVAAKAAKYTVPNGFRIEVGGTSLVISDGNVEISNGTSKISLDGGTVTIYGASVVNVKGPVINLDP